MGLEREWSRQWKAPWWWEGEEAGGALSGELGRAGTWSFLAQSRGDGARADGMEGPGFLGFLCYCPSSIPQIRMEKLQHTAVPVHPICRRLVVINLEDEGEHCRVWEWICHWLNIQDKRMRLESNDNGCLFWPMLIWGMDQSRTSENC